MLYFILFYIIPVTWFQTRSLCHFDRCFGLVLFCKCFGDSLCKIMKYSSITERGEISTSCANVISLRVFRVFSARCPLSLFFNDLFLLVFPRKTIQVNVQQHFTRFHESFKSICTCFMSYKQTWFDECRKMNAFIHTIILLVNSWAGFWSLFSNLFHQQRAQLSTTCKPKQKGFIAAAPRAPLILVLGAPPPSVESYPKRGTPAVWEWKMMSDDV